MVGDHDIGGDARSLSTDFLDQYFQLDAGGCIGPSDKDMLVQLVLSR